MSKTITVRLNDEEYGLISSYAKAQHRPISNFITSTVVREIEESYFVDAIELTQIKGDHELMRKINAGHRDAKRTKGKFVGR